MDFKEVQTYYHTIHSPRIQYITQMSSIPTNAAKDILRLGTERLMVLHMDTLTTEDST
jgi:hypothetical protein